MSALTTSPSSSHTRSRTAPAVLASLGVVALAIVARAPGLVRQLFDPDEAAIATAAMVVRRGGTMYVDVIDRKPPLAAYTYAASFFATNSRDLRPVHFLAALALGGAALLVAWEVRRRVSARAGWWAAGLLIAGVITFGPADAQAANFSHLALLPATGAIVLARDRRRWSLAAAGVLLGVAILTRQTWTIGLLPLGVAAYRRDRRAVDVVLALASSTLTVLAIAVVVPFGPFMQWTFTGNGNVVFGTGSIGDVIRGAAVFVGVFAAGHAALLWLAYRRGTERADLDLWVWVVTGLAAAFAGARFFGHYWLQVIPPLVLIAAPAVEDLTRRARVVVAAVTVIPLVLAWSIAWNPELLHRRANPDPLVAYVVAHTDANDSVGLWGSFPEVFWKSGRLPGGALVISDFVSGRSAGRRDTGSTDLAMPGARATYVDTLRRNPPKLFIDTSTWKLRNYENYPLGNVPELSDWLRSNYRPVAVVYGATIWERNAN